MYRPHSQLTRQYGFINNLRRSNDIKDLQSKTKKNSSKQYREYVKRLIENNPNHIDYQKRLKIQTLQSTNRSDLRQKIQKKLGEDDKQMWRSGVARFIKPKVSEKDYKRFKKLFDIFTKIQKTRNEILNISCSSTRYIKQGNSLYQNQRLRELKENLLRLQLDQEKILLEIQNEGKENRLLQVFLGEKAPTKHSHLMERDTNQQNGQTTIESQKQHKKHQEPTHERKQSSLSKKSTPNQNETSYLLHLNELIYKLDEKIREKSPEKFSKSTKSSQAIFQDIKKFMMTKQNTIDELFVSLRNLNKINHKDEEPQKSQPYDQVFKSSVHQQFSKFHDIQQQTKNTSNNKPKKTCSFNSLLAQLQQDLTQFKQISLIKERNNELAKKLLCASKDLRKCEQEKMALERQVKAKKQNDEQSYIVKKENELVHRKNQKLDEENRRLKEEIERLKEEVDKVKVELSQREQSCKQNTKFQKYYRQALTLEQQVKILSEQNEKLVADLKAVKQQCEHNAKNDAQEKQGVKEKQQSHQKSVKQSSTTSLIYKELEKKNKKLSQQNNKLSQQISELKSRIGQLSSQNQRMKAQNKSGDERLEKLKKETEFLEQENAVLLGENKKIQEEFEYIVREKLELESSLQTANRSYRNVMAKTQKLNEQILQLHQTISELKDQKQALNRQLHKLRQITSQMFSSIQDEVLSALAVLVCSLSNQTKPNAEICNDSQEQVEQKIQQTLPHFQQTVNLQIQCQVLVQELNHCVFELNSYKETLNQVQIQKQLQKKYFQQDILHLQLQIQQIPSLRLRICQLQSQKREWIAQLEQQTKAKSYHPEKVECQSQTQPFPGMKMASNTVSVALMSSTLTPQIKPRYLAIVSDLNQVSYVSSVGKISGLKINCELYSIQIQPPNLECQVLNYSEKFTQTQKQSRKSLSLFSNTFSATQNNYQPLFNIKKPPQYNHTEQEFLTFSDWIDSINLQSQKQTSQFKNFCSIHINTQHNLNLSIQTMIQTLKAQNQGLKNELERLKIKHIGMSQGRSPLKDMLSPGGKCYNAIQNKDQENGTFRVMGSLYNNFSFPKLDNLQLKDADHAKKGTHCQAYPPLQQKFKHSGNQTIVSGPPPAIDLHKTSSIIAKDGKQNLNTQKKATQNHQDEQQSFDLCII